ncbi:MAG: phosphoglucosamine mutase [Saprospiraceae bacterium]|nr:phosphoglucosamine mutase [Saprospiraceae bacterium]
MTLIKSISGIRGTTGGRPGAAFTPVDIVECTAAYAQIINESDVPKKIIVGRDGRMTGELVNALVVSTLMSMGIDVVDVGLSTTPTVEIAVKALGAGAGIIITASHNPREWNALKFLDHNGDFIAEATGNLVLDYIKSGKAEFASLEDIGNYEINTEMIDVHISKILSLPYVLKNEIRNKKFNVVIDCINSTGAISIVPLLEKLGCHVTSINNSITGNFAHNPEPLPEHLSELSIAVIKNKADLGIAVDPDVDRLAFVCEDGSMFGEEYTLVAAADFILGKKSGNTVSNLSSSRALKEITEKHGGNYFPSKVGEVNVVEKMKAVGAVIGGEGNGGVILPDLHYGRDALAGVALVLSLLAERNISLKQLKKTYPEYVISKNKISIPQNIAPERILEKIVAKYTKEEINTEDGLKIDFADGWVQLRKSNTEPILRVYSESKSEDRANALAKMLIDDVEELIVNCKL